MVETADVVVIGGGLHGCSAALHLARRGVTSMVIEKDHVGRHASGVNAGGVRRLGRDLAEVPLSAAAKELWDNIEDLVDDDCGFHATGQVKIAETEEELAALEARAQQVRELGFEHEAIVDRETLRDLLPASAPHCVGGMYVAGDGYADPARTTAAFRRKAESLGVRFFEGVAATGVERKNGCWHVATSDGAFEAPVLVNCAGGWADRIAEALGEHVPLSIKASMLMVTAPMPRFVEPVVGSQGRMLSFKQSQNGTVIIGGGHQGKAYRDENRTTVDFDGLAQSARTASALFPIMAGASIVRCWAGIEAAMPDGIPVIGPGAADDAYHAFGYFGHGFQLGPIVGSMIADIIEYQVHFPVLLYHAVHANDVRVFKPGDYLGLFLETLVFLGIFLQPGMHALDGHFFVVQRVPAFVNYSHAALAEIPLYLVPAGKDLAVHVNPRFGSGRRGAARRRRRWPGFNFLQPSAAIGDVLIKPVIPLEELVDLQRQVGFTLAFKRSCQRVKVLF